MTDKLVVAAFLDALDSEGINQAKFAERCGLSSAYITRFVQGARPEEGFFGKICTKWDNPKLGELIMAAHLRDEIKRGGLSPEKFTIEVKESRPRDSKHAGLDATLSLLRKIALGDPAVEKLLENVVAVAGPKWVRRKLSEP